MNTTPNFSAMQELMHRLGDPQDRLKYVHVAGTNGKGSTCAMLASVLSAAGYRTGLYTSPHLWNREERMQIGGIRISPEEWDALAAEVDAAAAEMNEKPLEFTRITAMAFLFFARQACDIVVLEVGMGGRMDPTNVIGCPEAAVITGLGLDHTAILGDTLEKIAAEKAGIIKKGCDVVLQHQSEEAETVIRAAAKAQGAALTVTDPSLFRLRSCGASGQVFDYRCRQNISLKLLGTYQGINAMTVLDTAEVLRTKGWRIGDEALQEGLRRVDWPARFELLQKKPPVILDGAHNTHGVRALAKCLADYFPGKRFLFVMGVMADKKADEMLLLLAPYAVRFITVTPGNERALDSRLFAEKIRSVTGLPAEYADTVPEGISQALSLLEKGADGADALCICGSLYQAGEVRHCFGLC